MSPLLSQSSACVYLMQQLCFWPVLKFFEEAQTLLLQGAVNQVIA